MRLIWDFHCSQFCTALANSILFATGSQLFAPLFALAKDKKVPKNILCV